VATNIFFRTTARILTTALVGGGAVLAGISPAEAATPSHRVESLTVVNAPSSLPYRSSSCEDGVAWGESANGYSVCVTRTGGPAAQPDGEPAAQPDSEPTLEADGEPASTSKDGKVNAVFEVTGSGTADAVTIDHGTLQSFSNVPMPFRKIRRVPADIDLLQVHVSGSHDNNTACRIILDGTVVVASPNGDCVYTR
jgi:hypothetical protein